MAENGNVKPNVLILGGVGFVGRNLVDYLVRHELAEKIRVVDKVLPPMAWLNAHHKESFTHVEFKHANLISPKSVTNAFTTKDDTKFDFVINCAGETKMGQTEAVYRDGIFKLSCNCAREAAKHSVRRYVEISSAHMASSDKKAMTEEVDSDPWTVVAKHKLSVENELHQMSDLDHVIIRPPIVYGKGDRLGLTPKLVIGLVYKQTGEKLKMLWGRDLKMNTVHVHDLCRAIWHLCYHGNNGEKYNIADKGNTTQGTIGDAVSELYNLNTDYVGSLASNLAKLTMEEVVEDVNEKHLVPWGEICQREGVVNTPLSPFIDTETLSNKHLHVDSSKLEATGFQYERPQLTVSLLKEIIEDFVEMKMFPPSSMQS